jgi:predicted DNA-binding protein (UPF0251 family)
MEEVVLSMDEVEAVRLADLDGLYHDQAAEKMNISRQTFGRIVEKARSKIAKALVQGLALRIEGGESKSGETRTFRCGQCRHIWSEPFGTGRPARCTACRSRKIFCGEKEQGKGETGAECPEQPGRV